MIHPRIRAFLQFLVLISVVAILFLLFPAAFKFVQGAARSVFRLWWLVLLVVLGIWLVWGLGRRSK